MPRNGSGTYSLPEASFVPNTPIASAAVNSDFSDIASAITASIASDGQTTITAQLKGFGGSAGSPGYSFSNDLNTGMFRVSTDVVGLSAGGTKVVDVSATGVAITGTFTVSATGWVNTADIANKAVTYAKIQDITASNRLLGRATSGAGVTEEITIGSGLSLSSTTLTAPAFPPVASFSGLSVKVASNTTVAVAATYVTVSNGTSTLTVPVSATCDLGTNGAVNSLDTGTIAANTWYYMYAISDGSTNGTLASTSSTSPTMPSGYTYKARIGAVKTVSGSAQLLGTWQFGKRAQYVVGLAQTTARQAAASTTSKQGDITVPTWVGVQVRGATSPVPPTATILYGGLTIKDGSATYFGMAPNNSYGSYTSTTNAPPVVYKANSDNTSVSESFTVLLESDNVYWASSGTASIMALWVDGWEDNL